MLCGKGDSSQKHPTRAKVMAATDFFSYCIFYYRRNVVLPGYISPPIIFILAASLYFDPHFATNNVYDAAYFNWKKRRKGNSS